MRKLSLLFIVTIFVFSCNNSNKKTKTTSTDTSSPKIGREYIIIALKKPDSTSELLTAIRVIGINGEKPKYDSVTKQYIVSIDTLWYKEVPIIDSATNLPKKDSAGNTLVNYRQLSKDSINTNVSNVSVTELTKKGGW